MNTLMENPFKLNHVVLYAKGWYKRTEDFINDVALMLEMDGIPGYHDDPYGVMSKLLAHWQQWAEWYNSVTPEDWTKKTVERLVTTNAKGIYRKYRKGSSYERTNFTDYYEVIIMAILIEWSHAEVKYMNVTCPDYTEEAMPNDAGLCSQREWYEEAEKIGYNQPKSLVKFFNKKVRRYWKKFDR